MPRVGPLPPPPPGTSPAVDAAATPKPGAKPRGTSDRNPGSRGSQGRDQAQGRWRRGARRRREGHRGGLREGHAHDRRRPPHASHRLRRPVRQRSSARRPGSPLPSQHPPRGPRDAPSRRPSAGDVVGAASRSTSRCTVDFAGPFSSNQAISRTPPSATSNRTECPGFEVRTRSIPGSSGPVAPARLGERPGQRQRIDGEGLRCVRAVAVGLLVHAAHAASPLVAHGDRLGGPAVDAVGNVHVPGRCHGACTRSRPRRRAAGPLLHPLPVRRRIASSDMPRSSVTSGGGLGHLPARGCVALAGFPCGCGSRACGPCPWSSGGCLLSGPCDAGPALAPVGPCRGNRRCHLEDRAPLPRRAGRVGAGSEVRRVRSAGVTIPLSAFLARASVTSLA